MKNPFLLLLTTLLPTVSWAQVTFSPAQPRVGQLVTLTYDPTPLTTAPAALTSASSTTLSANADTLFEAHYVPFGAPAFMPQAKPTGLRLTRQGSHYVGQFRLTKPGTVGALVVIRTARPPRRIDANNGRGYVLTLADSTGQPLPHALGGQASVFMRTSFLYGLGTQPDRDHVVSLYEQELAQHPAHRPLYWADHAQALIKQQKPDYKKRAKTYIDAYLAAQKTPAVADLNTAIRFFDQLGEAARATALREQLKTADPALRQQLRADAIRNEPNWAKQRAAYQAFVAEFPRSSYDLMLSNALLDGYVRANDLAGLVAFVDGQPAHRLDPVQLSAIAEQLADDRRMLPQAEWLAKRAVALNAAAAKARPSRNLAARQRQLLATHAYVLAQQGKWADAYTTYQQAISPGNPADTDGRTNERYWQSALRSGHANDASPYAEACLQAGRAPAGMRSSFRTWYAQKTSAADADAHLTRLEADLRAEQRAALSDKLIDEPAPPFALTDLNGRPITLSGLRGKVVVLDFWATWCGPCVASFPAMLQAQAHFQHDPAVQFLFVNTREGGPRQRVQNFVRKNAYAFTVPVDEQSKVSSAYNVAGIPAKVIIDPRGRVRYRALGYSGDADATVNELTLIVELLKTEK